MTRIVREITPLTDIDFFVILNHYNAKFDYPVHYHPEYELNLVINSSGKRIVGDSIEEFDALDLIFLGPNVPHAWRGEQSKDTHVVTIQFHPDILGEQMFKRKLTIPFHDMFMRANRGIVFSEEIRKGMKERILQLAENQGFESLISFITLLYDLSISKGQRMLASPSYNGQFDTSKSRRIKAVSEYLHNHLHEKIKIKDVANLVNMSETAFSHFFKKRTNRSFSDYLMDIRIGCAAKMLLESEKSISEICFQSGFNSISHFNRIFKRKQNCTPSEFREQQRLIIKY